MDCNLAWADAFPSHWSLHTTAKRLLSSKDAPRAVVRVSPKFPQEIVIMVGGSYLGWVGFNRRVDAEMFREYAPILQGLFIARYSKECEIESP